MKVEVETVKSANHETHTYIKGTTILHSVDDRPAVSDNYGTKQWFSFGQLHRVGGPALTRPNEEWWYRNGMLDRPDGLPAYTCWRGGKIMQESWYINGKLRRASGPALVCYSDDGQITHRKWLGLEGLDREDGPANEDILHPESNAWYRHGVLHALDGPALGRGTDRARYFIAGHEYSEQIWQQLAPQARLLPWSVMVDTDRLMRVVKDGWDSASNTAYIFGSSKELTHGQIFSIYADSEARELFWGNNSSEYARIDGSKYRTFKTQSDFDASVKFEDGRCTIGGEVWDVAEIWRQGRYERYVGGLLSSRNPDELPARVDIRHDAVIEFAHLGKPTPPKNSEWCTWNLTKGLRQKWNPVPHSPYASPMLNEDFAPPARILDVIENLKDPKIRKPAQQEFSFRTDDQHAIIVNAKMDTIGGGAVAPSAVFSVNDVPMEICGSGPSNASATGCGGSLFVQASGNNQVLVFKDVNGSKVVIGGNGEVVEVQDKTVELGTAQSATSVSTAILAVGALGALFVGAAKLKQQAKLKQAKVQA